MKKLTIIAPLFRPVHKIFFHISHSSELLAISLSRLSHLLILRVHVSGHHSDTSSSDPRSCEDTREAGSEAAEPGRESRLEEREEYLGRLRAT